MANLADGLPMTVFGKQHGQNFGKTIYWTRAGTVEAAPNQWGIVILKSGLGYANTSFVFHDFYGNEWEHDYSAVQECLKMIDKVAVVNYHADGAYRSVKDNASWKLMYRVGNYNMPRMTNLGASTTGSLPACPCFNCGFIIPMANIEIDHHKPQAGGGDQAIIKVWRHLGLTQAAGVGQLAKKNNAQIRGGMPRLFGQGTAMNPKGRNMGNWVVGGLIDDEDLSNRYALSPDGMLMLTIALCITNIDDLRTKCLNSYVNLRPLCSACNNNKKNQLKDIP